MKERELSMNHPLEMRVHRKKTGIQKRSMISSGSKALLLRRRVWEEAFKSRLQLLEELYYFV